MNGKKVARRQKTKQGFKSKIMKSMIHCHQGNWYEMIAEVFIFQMIHVSLHESIHELWNINFKWWWKLDGASVFSAIQTSVGCWMLSISLEASITKLTFYHIRCFLLSKDAFTPNLAEFGVIHLLTVENIWYGRK